MNTVAGVSTAATMRPDPIAWAALKADLMSVAKDWHARGHGKGDPTFQLSEQWIQRALQMPGIDSKSIDYLAKIVAAHGRLSILNGLYFVEQEDNLEAARKEEAKLGASIATSPLLQMLAKRVTAENL